MGYLLKNKSNNTLDILGQFIYPEEEIRVNNIDPYKQLIKSGFLQILEDDSVKLTTFKKNPTNKKINSYNTNHEIINNIFNKFPIKIKDKIDDNIINKTFIQEKIDNQEILTSLFHFYIDHKLSVIDLKNIKYFLTNVGNTKDIIQYLNQNYYGNINIFKIHS